MLLFKKMNKKDLENAKDWIISNQNLNGAIYWDEKGKCGGEG